MQIGMNYASEGCKYDNYKTTSDCLTKAAKRW